MFRATSLPIIRSSIVTLLGYAHHNLHETYQSHMYSGELLMIGREEARNMQSFMTE
jgi:hypothetical protein